MTAFSAATAFMALPTASEAITPAIHSEDLLNIRTLLAHCWRPKWHSFNTILQPPNDFKDVRAFMSSIIRQNLTPTDYAMHWKPLSKKPDDVIPVRNIFRAPPDATPPHGQKRKAGV
jgi:hypothetical protein